MNRYIIRKDGFIIGTARGKNNAVKHVKHELKYEGQEHLAKWSNVASNILCMAPGGEYVIERDTATS